jgi:hypothetical protein
MANQQGVTAPSPPQSAGRWPGLVASLGGEANIKAFTQSAAAQDGSPDPLRWEGRVQLEPNLCPRDTNALAVCNPATVQFSSDDCPDPLDATPVIIYEATRKSTMATTADAEQQRVNAMLVVSTSHKLEREFWEGAAAQALAYSGNQYLKDGNATQLNSGTATPMTYGFAAAARKGGALGEGQRLMHHVEPFVADLLVSAQVVRKEAGLLLDAFDNIVVAGSGYRGVGPGASFVDVDVPTTSWMFTTLIPQVRLSDIRPINTVDQNNNVVIAIAHRSALVTMDRCVQIATNLDLCNLCCA